jgi:hypothetical protein
MARLNQHERETKRECLEDAFEALKEESEKTGKNIADMITIIELANQDERMQAFSSKIGQKSVYSKAENSIYKPFVKRVKTWAEGFKKASLTTRNEDKVRISNLHKKLKNSELTIIRLQEETDEFLKRLEIKNIQIANLEKDCENYRQRAQELQLELNGANHKKR